MVREGKHVQVEHAGTGAHFKGICRHLRRCLRLPHSQRPAAHPRMLPATVYSSMGALLSKQRESSPSGVVAHSMAEPRIHAASEKKIQMYSRVR